MSRTRVARLMRAQGLCGRRRRRQPRTTDSQHALPIAENVLNRAFDVPTPNTVWAGDITYLATREGWVYLAVVLDLWSRRVVGYAMSDEPSRRVVLAALHQALARRPTRVALLHHSDRGSQYASHDYRALLGAEGIACSMSRRGNCWDTQFMMQGEPDRCLTRAGIGRGAFALTRRQRLGLVDAAACCAVT